MPESGASPLSKHGTHTEVEATVLGTAVEGLTIEFSRSISGRRDHCAWSAVTDGAGRLELTISSSDRAGVSGCYQARAHTTDGEVLARRLLQGPLGRP